MDLPHPGIHAVPDEPLEIFRACLGALLKAKTLQNMCSWEKALTTLKVTRTGRRPGIIATLNGDRAHDIEVIVDNCPLSTTNRYAFMVRRFLESVPETFYVYNRLVW